METGMIAAGIRRLSVMDMDLDLFEGQYPVPHGVSYNTYLIEDEKTALLDTVDARRQKEWLDGLHDALGEKKLDYLVISHMEPDHSGSIAALCAQQPGMTLVGNAKTFAMLDRFTKDAPLSLPRITVSEGGTLSLGRRTLRFFMAPMVHWPEVMVAYEEEDRLLFSADGFGCFGPDVYKRQGERGRAWRGCLADARAQGAGTGGGSRARRRTAKCGDGG